MEQLKLELAARHAEELNDKKSYCDLAEIAESHGHRHIAGVLRDIAHEEKQHAHLIKHILEELK